MWHDFFILTYSEILEPIKSGRALAGMRINAGGGAAGGCELDLVVGFGCWIGARVPCY